MNIDNLVIVMNGNSEKGDQVNVVIYFNYLWIWNFENIKNVCYK